MVSRKKGIARLEVEPYHKLSKAERREVASEGEAFLRFMEEGADGYEIEVSAVREA